MDGLGILESDPELHGSARAAVSAMYQNVTGLLRTSELLPELREIVRAALASEGELMPKVIYNGNGNTGGSVPVDNTSYAVNGSFTVAGLGSLTQGSNPFFFWNTKADGTGTIFNPGPSTFPNQSTDLTLFAIWGVTTGLTNGGVTTHFNFFYDPSLGGAGGIEPARINQLLAAGHGRQAGHRERLRLAAGAVRRRRHDQVESELPDPGSRDRRRRIGL